jgi:hypothetical protein
MSKKKVIYIIFVVVVAIGAFFYKNYFVSKSKNEIAYFMQTTKEQNPNIKKDPKVNDVVLPKLFGTLIITSGAPNSHDMANGIVCMENVNSLDKVDLFMPDMGHGSEPPKVTSIATPHEFLKFNQSVPNFGCVSVDSMQLFMPGTWQVRVFYKDGTIGIFSLDLKK